MVSVYLISILYTFYIYNWWDHHDLLTITVLHCIIHISILSHFSKSKKVEYHIHAFIHTVFSWSSSFFSTSTGFKFKAQAICVKTVFCGSTFVCSREERVSNVMSYDDIFIGRKIYIWFVGARQLYLKKYCLICWFSNVMELQIRVNMVCNVSIFLFEEKLLFVDLRFLGFLNFFFLLSLFYTSTCHLSLNEFIIKSY